MKHAEDTNYLSGETAMRDFYRSTIERHYPAAECEMCNKRITIVFVTAARGVCFDCHCELIATLTESASIPR